MPLVVHYWADLQSRHRLHCCDNITRMRNVSEYMLVLALCLFEVSKVLRNILFAISACDGCWATMTAVTVDSCISAFIRIVAVFS